MKTLGRIRFWEGAVTPQRTGGRSPPAKPPPPAEYEPRHPRGLGCNRFVKHAVDQTPTANKNKTQTMKGRLC